MILLLLTIIIIGSISQYKCIYKLKSNEFKQVANKHDISY